MVFSMISVVIFWVRFFSYLKLLLKSNLLKKYLLHRKCLLLSPTGTVSTELNSSRSSALKMIIVQMLYLHY